MKLRLLSRIPVSTRLCVRKGRIRLTEGSLAPVACLEGNENTCDRREQCSTLFVWEKLQKAIDDVVDNITLADIIANSADNYVI